MKFLLVLFLPLMVQSANVYEIAEPDLLEEIESKRESVLAHLKEEVKRLKAFMEEYRGEELEPAKKGEVYYIDPTYCLERDIYFREGGEWRVLYPRGYCFNPIDYLPYEPLPMVVFNPCREEELRYVKERFKEGEVIYVVSGCPLKEVRKLGLRVYYLTKELKERLRLKHTVSVISVDRERRAIKVEVVDVSRGSGREVY